MINGKETNQSRKPLSEQGFQALASLLNLAKEIEINPAPALKNVCEESALSPPDGEFTNQMIAKAEQLRKERNK